MNIIQCADGKRYKMSNEIIIQNLTNIMLNYQDLVDDYKALSKHSANLISEKYKLEKRVEELEKQVNALQENITHQLEECI